MDKEWISRFCNNETEYAEVKYGLAIFNQIVLGMLVAIFVGCVFGCIRQILLFILFFVPIRINAGGLHMKSSNGCLLFSGFVFCLIAILTCFYPIFSISPIIMIVGVITLYLMSPVGNSNKELLPKEVIRYKKRVRIILISECSIYLIASVFKINILKQAIELSIIVEAVSVLLGKFLDND